MVTSSPGPQGHLEGAAGALHETQLYLPLHPACPVTGGEGSVVMLATPSLS